MPSQHTLNVSLTREPLAYVARLVASGRYRSSSEVLRAALRTLERDELDTESPSADEPAEPHRIKRGVHDH